jgi:hypothetical protein
MQMAGIDAYDLFSSAKALGSTGANDSTNTLNLGQGKDAFGTTLVDPDIGMGKPVFVNIVMNTAAAATGGAAETTFELHHADDAGSNSGTPTTFYQLVTTPAIGKATLVAGWKISIAVPPGANQYLKVVNTVTTNNFTSGTYTAWLSGEPVATI